MNFRQTIERIFRFLRGRTTIRAITGRGLSRAVRPIRKRFVKIRTGYIGYVEKGATTQQPTFWVLFWGSVVAACAFYYGYSRGLSDCFGTAGPHYLDTMVAYGCFLLPAFVLRRLHFVLAVVLLLKGLTPLYGGLAIVLIFKKSKLLGVFLSGK